MADTLMEIISGCLQVVGFLLSWVFPMANGLAALGICAFAAVLMAIVRRFYINRASLQTVLRRLQIVVVVLAVAYPASTTCASLLATIHAFSNDILNDQLASEYWYRIFVGPFSPKECYLCGRDCEGWRRTPYLSESSDPFACPVTLASKFDQKVDLEISIIGYVAVIVWGLLAIPVSLVIEKGIHYFLLKIFPVRRDKLLV